jgi:hypothetical protein
MPEAPSNHTLERLYHRVAELEADLRVINSNIEYLERVVLGGRPASAPGEPRDNWAEIAEHVKEELFNYNLNHPQRMRNERPC